MLYRDVVYLRPELEQVHMVVSSQEAYLKLARSALILRQEAINSCILFDRIHLVDDQPVANIVCMYRLLSVRSLHHTTINKSFII